MTQEHFHLPLDKQGHTLGLVNCFVEKIPFKIGYRIFEQIPRHMMKACRGDFEEFLTINYEKIAKFLVTLERRNG